MSMLFERYDYTGFESSLYTSMRFLEKKLQLKRKSEPDSNTDFATDEIKVVESTLFERLKKGVPVDLPGTDLTGSGF